MRMIPSKKWLKRPTLAAWFLVYVRQTATLTRSIQMIYPMPCPVDGTEMGKRFVEIAKGMLYMNGFFIDPKTFHPHAKDFKSYQIGETKAGFGQPCSGKIHFRRSSLGVLMGLMSREAKKIFSMIHEEYENQCPTVRGETPYTEALLELQHRLLSKPKTSQAIKSEYERLKAKHRLHPN